MTGSKSATHKVAPVGRFAPSPTGRMHAGNIFAYLMAWLDMKSRGGSIVLRIEDLDVGRSRAAYATQLMFDLESLGLTWDSGPYYQHNRTEAYQEALHELEQRAHIYECYCSRADLRSASAPHRGESMVYPGMCRNLSPVERMERREQYRQQGRQPSLRIEVPNVSIRFDDVVYGPQRMNLAQDCGDFIIQRSDGSFAYQLAVVVDDAAQGVTSVVRGEDLITSTPQQIFLQQALGYPTPTYAHVPLLVAEDGRRLAKRNHDAAFDALLERFETPAAIIGHCAYLAGLIPEDCPCRPEDLLSDFSEEKMRLCLGKSREILWK